MKVASLKGPISIQPSEQDLVVNPRDDVEMYSKAPLSSGQSVKVKDLVVFAEEVTKQRATFKVLANLDYQAKQNVEAKAVVELKDKQAEAKSAATKKVTITCRKGKLTKNVIAVKPKCPSGYKLKK